jgi:hypothetical protein
MMQCGARWAEGEEICRIVFSTFSNLNEMM